MNPVLRTQLAGVSRRPARLLLTGLAVLVASFVVYATVLAQQITERSVLNGLSGTPEAVDLVVHEGSPRTTELAADLAARVDPADGLGHAGQHRDPGELIGGHRTADHQVGCLGCAADAVQQAALGDLLGQHGREHHERRDQDGQAGEQQPGRAPGQPSELGTQHPTLCLPSLRDSALSQPSWSGP